MPSVKAQYDEALSLAKDGKYSDALTILSKLDHPAARKLENQIKEKVGNAPRVNQTTRSKSRRWLWAALGAVVIVLAVFGAVVYSSYQQGAREAHMRAEMLLFCYDTNPQVVWDGCLALADANIAAYRDEIEYCLAQSNDGDLEEQFNSCLIENGVD